MLACQNIRLMMQSSKTCVRVAGALSLLIDVKIVKLQQPTSTAVKAEHESASSNIKELYMSPSFLAMKRRNQAKESKALLKSLVTYRKNDE